MAPRLADAVRAVGPTVVFLPMGLANPDHALTHDAGLMVRETLLGGAADGPGGGAPTWFCYEDAGYKHLPGTPAWRVAKLFRGGLWPTPAVVPVQPDMDAKRAAIWLYASQVGPLERDHLLSERLAANTPEQYWRLEPPPSGWERHPQPMTSTPDDKTEMLQVWTLRAGRMTESAESAAPRLGPGTTALVTGASSGIGAATAGLLAVGGTTVALVARRADRLEEVAEDCRVTAPRSRAWAADLGDTIAAAELAVQIWDELGPLDVVVNNAAVPMRRPATRVTMAEVERTMTVNFYSPVAITLALLPRMLERGSGILVNVRAW